MNIGRASAALSAIAAGFTLLAQALEMEEDDEPFPDAQEAAKEVQGRKPRTSKPKDPPAEEPEGDQEDPPAEESSKPKAVELSDLQGIAGDMIREGDKPRLLQVLKKFGLKNLSSADPSDYQKIHDELKNDG